MAASVGRRPTPGRRARRRTSRRPARWARSRLTWSARDRRRRRDALQRPPLGDGRLHPARPNRVAQPTGIEYTDTGLARRHLLLPGHRRGRAPATSSDASNQASAMVTARHVAAGRLGHGPGSRRDRVGQRRADRRRVRRRRRSRACGSRSMAPSRQRQDTSAPYSAHWDSRAVANGPHDADRRRPRRRRQHAHVGPVTRNGRQHRRDRRRPAWWPRTASTRAAARPPPTAPAAGTAASPAPTWARHRALRRRALVRRRQRPGQGGRRRNARPHEWHDARGLGAADRGNSWRTHSLKEHGETSPTACTPTSTASRPNAQVFVGGRLRDVNGTAAGVEHVDAPGRDLRRRRTSACSSTAPQVGTFARRRARCRTRPGRCTSAATRRSANGSPA